MPLLHVWAAKFQFAPVSERWVEGLHASTKRSTRSAPNAGPTHIAFEFMLPFLRQWLQEEPARLAALASHGHSTRRLDALCRCVGLSGHPGVQRLVSQKVLMKTPRVTRADMKHVVNIVFHCDAESHFRPLPKALVGSRVVRRGVNWALPAQPGSLWDQVWFKYALQFLRTEIKQNSDQSSLPADIFSVRNNASPLPLQSFTSPAPSPAAAVASENFQCFSMIDSQQAPCNVDASSRATSTSASQPLLFFRVTHLSPGNAVVVSGVPHLEGRDSFCIEQLRVLQADMSETRPPEACVAVDGDESSLLVLAASTLSLADLLSLQQWQVAERLRTWVDEQFTQRLPSEDQSTLQGLLQDMLRARAFDFTDDPRTATLQHHADGFASCQNRRTVVARLMAAQGLFTCCRRGDTSSEWQLTLLGKHCLQLGMALFAPRPVFTAPEKLDVESACKTAPVLLLLYLQKHGWAFSRRDEGQKPRIPPAYEAGSARVCWLHHSQTTLCHEYLAALATAEDHQKPVPHFQRQDVYVSLLGGASSKKPGPRRAKSAFQFGTVFDSSLPEAPAQPKRRKVSASHKPKAKHRGQPAQEAPAPEVFHAAAPVLQETPPDSDLRLEETAFDLADRSSEESVAVTSAGDAASF